MNANTSNQVGADEATAPSSSTAPSACFPNIGGKERKKRAIAGAVTLVVGAAVLAAMLATNTDRWYRLALLVVWWVSAVGFIQAREKT